MSSQLIHHTYSLQVPKVDIHRPHRPTASINLLKHPQLHQPIHQPHRIPQPHLPPLVSNIPQARTKPKPLPPLIHNQKYLPLRRTHLHLHTLLLSQITLLGRHSIVNLNFPHTHKTQFLVFPPIKVLIFYTTLPHFV